MKMSEFELGRKKYTNLLRRKKKYLEKKKRLYDLLKEPLIKEYLELSVFLSQHTDEEFDEKLLGIKAFDKLAKKTEHSNAIYMYVGEDKSKNIIFLVDIETMKKIEITPNSYNNLKQHNHIIFIENKNNDEDFYEKKMMEIRNSYLSSLTELDQESAKEKVLKLENL